MLTIAVILGSTRPGRNGEQVARWVVDQARNRPDADFTLVDLADHPLPFLDEKVPPSMGRYEHEHTKEWARLIDSFDGYVIVTPEYNHSIPGVLKNALDFVYVEWNNKAMGVVSYGSAGGVRAAEHLRLIAGELQMADVRINVALPLATEFVEHREFSPSERSAKALDSMLDQLVGWSGLFAQYRERPAE